MLSGKTIFISALDWGLGHATRCVPIIRRLEKDNKIIIGLTPLTKEIFETEFPFIEKINFPAYNIRYSSVLPVWLKLLADWPRISFVIKKEQILLEETIDKYKIDVVISDSRFGLHSKKAKTIFITHQLFLKAPFANRIAQQKNKKFILNFDEVWVPDFEDEGTSLSGKLSHDVHYHSNIQYIQPQSRLLKTSATTAAYDCLFILSGPQPQQQIFSELIITKIKANPALKFAMVCSNKLNFAHENTSVFISPNAASLSEIICSSKKIICRSGYSTLMDLHTLDKQNIILVPTPGQTEQEYLAEYWAHNFGALSLPQSKFSTLKLE
ncbi:MAG: hypothetical protein H0W61_01885 [Bacteroidetes bacterium]|nr:hypothetical protein [Bacteroidota bacterium]